MLNSLEEHRARLSELQNEVGYLTDRMRKARQGLVQQTFQTRATILESRELMKRADQIIGIKTPSPAAPHQARVGPAE